ncbi:MAG: carboxymuconolactone decarboxylase family protein [Leptolyngbya sp. BL-A-14]
MQILQHADTRNCYGQGWGKRHERANAAGAPDIDNLKNLASDRCFTSERVFDDLDACTVWALRSQELATITVLTVLGNAQPQLKVQIHYALNVGCTRTQVVAAILKAAVQVGFAAISPSTTTAEEVFQERDA